MKTFGVTITALFAALAASAADQINIDALGGVIPNNSSAEVHITTAEGSGSSITLAADDTKITSLHQDQSDVNAVVSMARDQKLSLRTVEVAAGATDLMIGDVPGIGILAGDSSWNITFSVADILSQLRLNALFSTKQPLAVKDGLGTVRADGDFHATVEQKFGSMAYAITGSGVTSEMPALTIAGSDLFYDVDTNGEQGDFSSTKSTVTSDKEAVVTATAPVPLRGFNVNQGTTVRFDHVTAFQPEAVEAVKYGEEEVPGVFRIGDDSVGVLEVDGGSFSAKLSLGSGAAGTGKGVMRVTRGGIVSNLCSAANIEYLVGCGKFGALEINGGRFVAGGWLGVGEANYAQALITVSTNGLFTMTPSAVRPSGLVFGGVDTYVSLLVEASGRFSAVDASLGVNIPASSVTVAKEARVSAIDGGLIDMGGNRITSARAAVFNMTDGGVIRARSIDGGAFIQFNGGTYRTSGDAEPLLDGTIWSFEKGATIDVVSGSSTISSASPILKPTGRGLLAVEIPESLAEKTFLSAPYFSVVSTSGGGNGATVVCELDGTGRIANFRVTGRGSGYMQAKGILYYGNDKFEIGSEYFEWTDNVSGGLVKTGSGTLVMKGVNTYEGDTDIRGGKVVLNGAGCISPKSGLSLSNGAAFDLGGGEASFSDFGGDGSGSVVNGTLHLSGLVFDMEKVKAGEIDTLNLTTNIVFDATAGIKLLNVEGALSHGNDYVLCNLTGDGVPDRLPPLDDETKAQISESWGVLVKDGKAILHYFDGSLFIYY